MRSVRYRGAHLLYSQTVPRSLRTDNSRLRYSSRSPFQRSFIALAAGEYNLSLAQLVEYGKAQWPIH